MNAEVSQTDDLIARATRTKERLDRMLETLVLRRVQESTSQTVILNPLDDLLAELQLLASSVIVGELKDSATRQALLRFAKRFEELDAALSGGLPLPAEWQRRRR